MSLAEALQKALKGRTLSIIDAAEAVQKLGYKSKSKNFRAVVSLTFLKHRKLFEKKGRGLYTAE